MITIQDLLDLGILIESNYMYDYDDIYNGVIDYAYNFESKVDSHLIILSSVIENDYLFKLRIMPDEYLKHKYAENKNRELIAMTTALKEKCVSIGCKECPYYTNAKPGGSPFENCKLVETAPYLW